MDYNTLIIYYIVLTGTYLLLFFTLIKENRTLKKDLIFSYSFFTIVTIFLTLSLLDEKEPIILETILSLIMFLITFNLVIYYKNKNQGSFNNIKTTYLKGKKIKYIIISFAFTYVLLVLLLNNGFKEHIFWTISNIVILALSISWNVYYFLDQKKKNISKEVVIIYNHVSYTEYDVTRKSIINLNRITCKKIKVLKEKSFMIYLTKEGINTLIWTFYIEDFTFDKETNFNNDFFEMFNNIQGTYAQINMDDNTINVL